MKFFSGLFFALGCISLASAKSPSARLVVRSVKDLAETSRDLSDLCQSLNTNDIRLNGLRVARGLTLDTTPMIVSLTKVVLVKQIPFNRLDTDLIVDALLAFVEVHKRFLAILIGKHELLADFDFATPIRIALVAFEKAIDDLAASLIRLIPTRRADGDRFQRELDTACGQAIIVYSRPSRADSGFAREGREFAAPAEAYYEYYLKVAKYYQDAKWSKQHCLPS